MEFKIMLVFPKEVSDIVKIASTIPAMINVTIESGSYKVDAKSMMGIFSLDLSKPITLRLSCDENYAIDYAFYKSLFKKYIVKS